MGDSPSEYLYRLDLKRSHELAFDLMAYGSTLFPAFEATLSTISAYTLDKLQVFAPSARRVLETEVPSGKERIALKTSNPRFMSSGHKYEYIALPLMWIFNGIIHCRDIWINHLYDPNRSWTPTGAIHLLGFGLETDQRRLDHVDLFAFAHGYLSRPKRAMAEFFERNGL